MTGTFSAKFLITRNAVFSGRDTKLAIQEVAFKSGVDLDMQTDIGWFTSQFTGTVTGTAENIEVFKLTLKNLSERLKT